MKTHQATQTIDIEDVEEIEEVEELEVYEDEPVICDTCNGSGEGQYEGTNCRSCKGRGEVHLSKEDFF